MSEERRGAGAVAVGHRDPSQPLERVRDVPTVEVGGCDREALPMESLRLGEVPRSSATNPRLAKARATPIGDPAAR